MPPPSSPVVVSEDQALHFRALRSHLAGPGAPDATGAARDVLGAQAQQLAPALFALSQRTRARPSALDLRARLFDTPRRLVHTWGQRETLHLIDPADWPTVVAAREEWAPAGRRGPMPTERALVKALARLEKSGSLRRAEFEGVAAPSYERALAEHPAVDSPAAARRLAAARLIWRLSMRGDACLAQKVGSEQLYAARSAWFGELEWSPAPARAAATALTRRYFGLHAPATVRDVAHFFGARMAEARRWVATLEEAGELVAVECGDRPGLLALAADAASLRARVPRGAAAWPPRLLPAWDTLLMAHADKSWTVPDEADRPRVWRKAAMVAAGVVARGRVIAVWTQARRRGRVEVEVEALRGWSARLLPAARREAAALAEHLGLEGAECRVIGAASGGGSD